MKRYLENFVPFINYWKTNTLFAITSTVNIASHIIVYAIAKDILPLPFWFYILLQPLIILIALSMWIEKEGNEFGKSLAAILFLIVQLNALDLPFKHADFITVIVTIAILISAALIAIDLYKRNLIDPI